MLSHIELTKKGTGGASQAADYLFSSEYYLGAEGEQLSRVVWLGQGAQALGLEQGTEANAQTLSYLLDGFTPDGKTKLTQNAGRENRTLGHDLTFSADKSISILFAAVSPQERERLLELHHRAGEAAVGYLQEEIKARRGHAGERSVAVEGLVIARVDHFSSREQQAQLHSHYCVANLAMGADGRWSTFDAEAFESHKHGAGALYRAEMAKGLQELGYAIDSTRELDKGGRETGQVWHRVAGVGQETMEHFSLRSRQIKDWMAEHGCSAQEACLRTRQGKEGGEPDASRIMEQTGRELDELRAQGVVGWASAEELKAEPGHELESKTDAQILERLHANESSWGRANLIDALAKERGAELGAQGVLAEAEAFMGRNALLELTNDRQGRPRWASKAQDALEQGIAAKAIARANDQAVRVPSDTMDDAIARHEKEKGFTLNPEQVKAARWATEGTGGVACITGWAGTGKTAMAGAMVKGFEANGQRVIGACTAWDAADKLASETGLETYSTAALLWQLDSGKMKLTDRDVVMLDEAGMVGASTVAKLQDHIDKAGGKLVMVGDALQLQPVEAGAPFRLAQEAVGHSALTEIRRQREGQDRELAAAFYGKSTGAEIIAQMMDRKQLEGFASTKEARAGLVAAYLADPTPAREKLVIAPTNEGARAITGAIRGGLKERGELQGAQPVKVAGALEGETRELDLAVGDRVRFGKRDKAMGVSNGSIGVVEQMEDGKKGHRLAVRLESDIAGKDGKLVSVETAKYRDLDHGYAGTVHKAQGQGKDTVYWHAEGGSADRHLGLVAFTRTKKELHAFSSDHGLDKLEKSLDNWRQKQNASEMLAPQKELAKIVTKEQTQELGAGLGALLKQRGATLVQTPKAMNHEAAKVEQAQQQTPQPKPQQKPQTDQERRDAEKALSQRQERSAMAQQLNAARGPWQKMRGPLMDAHRCKKAAEKEALERQEKLTAAITAKEMAMKDAMAAQRRVDVWQQENSRKHALGFKAPRSLRDELAAKSDSLTQAVEMQGKRQRAVDRQIERAQGARKAFMAEKIKATPAYEAMKNAKTASKEMKTQHRLENRTVEEMAKELARVRREAEKARQRMGPNFSNDEKPMLIPGPNDKPQQTNRQGQTLAHKRERDRGWGMSM